MTAQSSPLDCLVDFATQTCGPHLMAIVWACAAHGNDSWRVFAPRLFERLASDHALTEQFIAGLCKSAALLQAGPILEAFLAQMDATQKEDLFKASLLKKNGFVHYCFAGSARTLDDGPMLLDVLEGLVRHGLRLQPLAQRHHNDMELAVRVCNAKFLRLVLPWLHHLDERIIKCAALKSDRPLTVIDIFLEAGIPVSRFNQTRLLEQAKVEVQHYIRARVARVR
ncbi:hypothetical protein [Noviherbaspirillum aerium]|uniref:hypothetical protein n=1 Tax=Noviherbaspirillum aerium TaxID=2588497 RepID=UPI00124C8E74|nr:hypothetical protein [Noviherbaspirillum aerium]